MKRFFASMLILALLLGMTGGASAFSWEKPAEPTAEEIGYAIEVVKCTLHTGAAGTFYYQADDSAAAVNGADVYWAVKLTVDGPSDQVASTAYADVTFTGLDDALSDAKKIPLSGLEDGVYYFMPAGESGSFQKIDTILASNHPSPVQATRCLDTETAQVSARVYSERNLDEAFNVGDYDVRIRPFLPELRHETPASSLCYLRQDNYVAEDGKKEYVDTDYEWLANYPNFKFDKDNGFVDLYKNTSGNTWNPNRQFRFSVTSNGWTFNPKLAYTYEHIFVIGGYPFILKVEKETKYTALDFALTVYEMMQSKLNDIKNDKGEHIPGLTVSLDLTAYETPVYQDYGFVVVSSSDGMLSYVLTFSAPNYNWNAPGNGIRVEHYHSSYSSIESELRKLITFYQAAQPPYSPGTGPAIAQFVLSSSGQVQAVLTSEAEWTEYFAKEIKESEGSSSGTVFELEAQCPRFLNDTGAYIDLLSWLDEGNPGNIIEAIEAREMYMTTENLWNALGYAYYFEDSASWTASTVPIITMS